MKHPMILFLLVLCIERATAAEFEKMGSAIAKILGSNTGIKRSKLKVEGQSIDAFYSKAGGAPKTVVFIQKGIYEPNCTHTWAIGVDTRKHTIQEIRTLEMSCPHAFPAREASFLNQYRGKGPADLQSLKSKIATVAKATGSCDLTTDAVRRSILAMKELQGKI